MSGNHPFQPIFQTFEKFSNGVQSHLSTFLRDSQQNSSFQNGKPVLSLSPNPRADIPGDSSSLQPKEIPSQEKSAIPVSKEALGRATWTFLHTLAAQYPDKPTRQQRSDVKGLMAILSRVYPWKERADHFKEVLRANPVRADSQFHFSQWLCHVHNVVNRSLGKLVFPCQRVDARWGKVECENRACDVIGNASSVRN